MITVTKSTSRPHCEAPTEIDANEARLLAMMLRTSRLSWAFGEPGTDNSALLRWGVLPQLQRRCADRGSVLADQTPAPPVRERRNQAGGALSARRIEVAIYFDSWDEAPLPELKARIEDAIPGTARGGIAHRSRLGDALEDLASRHGVHFVFLLAGFEGLLAAAPGKVEAAQFFDEWVDAVMRPELPASFLVSLDVAARPRLERLRDRMPGFDHNSLRLIPSAAPDEPLQRLTSDAAPNATMPSGQPSDLNAHTPRQELLTADLAYSAGLATQAQLAAHRSRPTRPLRPPQATIKVEEVYAFIESTLTKTSMQEARAPWQEELAESGGNASVSAMKKQPPEPAAGVQRSSRTPRAATGDSALIHDEKGRTAPLNRVSQALKWIRNRRRQAR